MAKKATKTKKAAANEKAIRASKADGFPWQVRG